jgi:hypothetical protein
MLRPKIRCEICGLENPSILHRHHIIPRNDSRSNNGDGNLAILCPTCHSCVHMGKFIIIGIYDTTDGKELMWFENGKEPPISKEFWLIKDNPLVITIKEK